VFLVRGGRKWFRRTGPAFLSIRETHVLKSYHNGTLILYRGEARPGGGPVGADWNPGTTEEGAVEAHRGCLRWVRKIIFYLQEFHRTSKCLDPDPPILLSANISQTFKPENHPSGNGYAL